jgi:class 3 adenylate cyclase
VEADELQLRIAVNTGEALVALGARSASDLALSRHVGVRR